MQISQSTCAPVRTVGQPRDLHCTYIIFLLLLGSWVETVRCIFSLLIMPPVRTHCGASTRGQVVGYSTAQVPVSSVYIGSLQPSADRSPIHYCGPHLNKYFMELQADRRAWKLTGGMRSLSIRLHQRGGAVESYHFALWRARNSPEFFFFIIEWVNRQDENTLTVKFLAHFFYKSFIFSFSFRGWRSRYT